MHELYCFHFAVAFTFVDVFHCTHIHFGQRENKAAYLTQNALVQQGQVMF